MSAVAGTVIPELHNTVIVCRDGLLAEGERQEITVSVLGEYLINVLVYA